MAATNELVVERHVHARSASRRRANFVIFLGPAIALTVIFFVTPVLIDIAVSFTGSSCGRDDAGKSLYWYRCLMQGLFYRLRRHA